MSNQGRYLLVACYIFLVDALVPAELRVKKGAVVRVTREL